MSTKIEAPQGVGTSGGSASQRRIRQMELAIQRDRLSQSSELTQIKYIARHYAANFQTARDILEIVKLGSYTVPLDENASACVRMLADQIRNNAAADLGIELSWPNTPSETRREQRHD